MSRLFEPLQLGEVRLKNRVVMGPLTRCRAALGRVPTALMAEYYAQRASAGLIISEATAIMPMGVGYPDSPGIWSNEQVAGWKQVTAAVHKMGGVIFMQLWHVGRISDPYYLNGALPVAPSAIAPGGYVSLMQPKKAFVTPRALELDEIPAIIEAYRQGAENAKRAGFDGVELHGANGYLLDQFLQDKSNQRNDAYGGPIENRARLMLEATDAAISVFGAGRVGVHLAPRGDAHSMGDSNPLATFTYLAREFAKRGIAFICAREHAGENRLGPQIQAAFGGVYIANEQFTVDSAEAALAAGEADAVAWGKLYIANPDLAERIQLGGPFTPPDPATFYGGNIEDYAKGYTDYPALSSLP